MSDRRRFALAVVAVLAVALAARTITLYWSPYPATLDGIAYADQARDTLAAGAFPLAEFRADNIGWAGTLAVAAAVFDVRPITLAQPLVAVIGTASCLVGIALVRRLGAATGLSGRATTVAAVLSGFGLAVEGQLLATRTTAPRPGFNTYGFITGEGIAWVLVFIVLFIGLERSRPGGLLAGSLDGGVDR